MTRLVLKKNKKWLIVLFFSVSQIFLLQVSASCSIDSVFYADMGSNLQAGTISMGQIPISVTCSSSDATWSIKASGTESAFSLGTHNDYYVIAFSNPERTQVITQSAGLDGVGTQTKNVYLALGRGTGAYNTNLSAIVDVGSFTTNVPLVLFF